MPTKTHFDQHNILHIHYPNDCCLCKAEQEIATLKMKISELENLIKEQDKLLKNEGKNG